jgi:NADH:ubiquinone oxidoreductase subunit 5 (subunit L)/multisubunit Na+/H+ antiporter MnhA subunit
MVNHGLSTGALFLMVGLLYERRHTRNLDDFGGLWQSMPVYCGFFLVVAMSSAGLPGLNGFVGEFTIMLGAYNYMPIFAVLAAVGVILAAWYLLTAFRKMAQGEITNPENDKEHLKDLNFKKWRWCCRWCCSSSSSASSPTFSSTRSTRRWRRWWARRGHRGAARSQRGSDDATFRAARRTEIGH